MFGFDAESFLTSIPPVAVYAVTGGMIMVESFGVPLPGETTLIAASLLAATPGSSINPWILGTCAILGAVIGDSIGYAIGNRFGSRLLRWMTRRFPNHITPLHIRYAEFLFAQHGWLPVFGGRFIALLRILAGPLAGALNMPYRTFVIANVTGAIAWAGGMTTMVVLVGDFVHTYFSNFALFALIGFVGFIIFTFRWIHRTFEKAVKAFGVEEARLAAKHGLDVPTGFSPLPIQMPQSRTRR